MQRNVFMAHHRDENGSAQIHTMQEHSINTAEGARTFAEGFAACQLAYDIALLHDVGKYSKEFQERIRGARVVVDHSTPGGKLMWEKNRNALGMMAAYCIMGHHGGLPDGGTTQDSPDESTLHGRLKKTTVDCSQYKDELTPPLLKPPEIKIVDGFGAALLVRMLFSTLVDADFLDTEAFFTQETRHGAKENILTLLDKLCLRLDGFLDPIEPVSELNSRRTALLKNCLSVAKGEGGLFTLTAPTGSGKTIASMAFALMHSAKRGMSRVIYVVPYNTIIEQNAAVFEGILGAENILQHHSNISYDDKNEESNRKRLATENWDFPIVVTSSVQFFQSLFADRPSGCRKLHNIANSVIVFDEAQMIPVPYLIPCVRAIRELVTSYGCTAVLATATQSALERYFAPLVPTEIAENPTQMHTFLRRANIRSLPEPLTNDELHEHLAGYEQALCVVNTRKTAQHIFKRLHSESPEGVFHLSTFMYPKHRTHVLGEIRRRLAGSQRCVVVSTSLVEAGVDLDFPVVYREEAGLDSIVQAAGRCNREGRRVADESFVYVFTLAGNKPPRALEQNIAATRQAMRSNPDAASLEAIKAYFTQLLYIRGDEALDIKQVVPRLNSGLKSFSFPFKEISKEFQIIDEDTVPVYVLREAPELEARLRRGERSRELFRLLGPYCVSLYHSHMRSLFDNGFVERLDEETLLLFDTSYDQHCGVIVSQENDHLLIL